MANITSEHSTELGLYAIVGASTAVGIIFIVTLGIFLLFRFRRRGLMISSIEIHPGEYKRGSIRSGGSFREKRQKNQRFPFINYWIRLLGIGSKTSDEAEDDVIYDVPWPRGIKRPCSSLEHLHRPDGNARKCMRSSYHSTESFQAFLENEFFVDVISTYDAKDVIEPKDLTPWEKISLNETDSVDSHSDDEGNSWSIPENIYRMSGIFSDGCFIGTDTGVRSHDVCIGSLPAMTTRDDQSTNDVKHQTFPVRNYRSALSRFLARRRGIRCSLEIITRTWSFRSLLEQWRNYCEEALETSSSS